MQLRQADDFTVNIFNVVGLRVFGQSRHTKNVACNGHNHFSTGIEHHVLYLNVETTSAPYFLASAEKENCVLAIHTGK